MTQATTPDFEDSTAETSDEVLSDLDLEVEDDANLDLDVDVPEDTDEVEDTSEMPTENAAAKPKTTRVPAPEGYVKPVAFAKILSEHLKKTVPPQVVYSYIKNNSGSTARNPFPVHEVNGYAMYIKPEEGLEWWDAKNGRVAAAKTAKADKDAAKAAKSSSGGTVEPQGTVEEAE